MEINIKYCVQVLLIFIPSILEMTINYLKRLKTWIFPCWTHNNYRFKLHAYDHHRFPRISYPTSLFSIIWNLPLKPLLHTHTQPALFGPLTSFLVRLSPPFSLPPPSVWLFHRSQVYGVFLEGRGGRGKKDRRRSKDLISKSAYIIYKGEKSTRGRTYIL